MTSVTAPQPLLHDRNLLWWVVASAAAHGLLMQLLPGWRPFEDKTPPPLQVELRQPAPEMVPPKPLPMEPQPLPRERPKPQPQKPQPVQAAPREERPVEAPRAPILTAPPEAPVTAATPVVPPQPEQKPTPPPPVHATEPPRPPPIAAPSPITPPRSDAAYLNNPRPNYPAAARRRGDQGTVYVRVLVTANGHAGSVGLEKSSGHPSLDEAALTAVKSWRFVPAKQGDKAIDSPYVVPLVFRLDQ